MVEAYSALARYYGESGKQDDALHVLTEAAQHNENNAQLLLFLGAQHLNNGSFVEAIDFSSVRSRWILQCLTAI